MPAFTAGLYFLEPGQSIDVEFWWGAGDDHGAAFVMGRYPHSQYGPVGIHPIPGTTVAFMTSNFTKKTNFTLAEITEFAMLEYPTYSYVVTITNTGPLSGVFTLDGMSSI